MSARTTAVIVRECWVAHPKRPPSVIPFSAASSRQVSPESTCAPASPGVCHAALFHSFIDGEDKILDPDGLEMPAERVADYALRSARDCIAGDVMKGIVNLTYRIEVRDAAGAIVHTLMFEDAVDVIRQCE